MWVPLLSKVFGLNSLVKQTTAAKLKPTIIAYTLIQLYIATLINRQHSLQALYQIAVLPPRFSEIAMYKRKKGEMLINLVSNLTTWVKVDLKTIT